MLTVRFLDAAAQEVKDATWFQFSDGILYLYGESNPDAATAPLAAFPQCNVLSVRKTGCCCPDST